jgi:hypothetical protein
MKNCCILSAHLAVVSMAGMALAPAAHAEGTWAEPVEVAAGGGYKGPWRMNASKFHYVDDPTVAINQQGVVGVAYADLPSHDIFFQAFSADGEKRLPAPVNISNSPAVFSWLPRMVISDRDPMKVYVLWQEIVFSGGSHGGEIFFARSDDGGKTFTDPVNLSNSLPGDGKGRLTQRYWDNGSLDLAVGTDGMLYAAWTEYEGTLWFRRSADGGKTFSQPLSIVAGGGSSPARGPALALAPEGVVYIAWAVGEDPGADIHFSLSSDVGRSFSAPRVVHETEGHSDAPKIVVDSKGTIHLVYAESPGGRFKRYHIRYARSKNGGRSFESPRDISDPESEVFYSVNFPAISINGDDHLYVLFELFPERGQRSRGLGLTYSRNNGRTFAPPVMVPGSTDPSGGINGSQQGLLMKKLAVNDDDAIAIVNSTFIPGKSSQVRLFRGRLDSQ